MSYSSAPLFDCKDFISVCALDFLPHLVFILRRFLLLLDLDEVFEGDSYFLIAISNSRRIAVYCIHIILHGFVPTAKIHSRRVLSHAHLVAYFNFHRRLFRCAIADYHKFMCA